MNHQSSLQLIFTFIDLNLRSAMEVEISLAISVGLVLFSFLLPVILFRRHNKSDDHDVEQLPPGSFGWPFIGESLEFLFGKPENFVGERMKKYSPDIFKTKILGEKTAVLCGPGGNKFLFSNEHKLFTEFRPHSMQHLFRTNISKSDPKAKTDDEVKAMIRQPGFLKPEALSRFLGTMDSTSNELIQSLWIGKDQVKAYPSAKFITLTLSCRYFLGLENPETIAKLVNHFDDVSAGLHSIVLNFPGTIFYKANKGAAAIRKELLKVIQDRKISMAEAGTASRQDVLSHMIAATDPSGKSMPDAEIAHKMTGVIVSGFITVATTITFLMKHVGERPDVYEKIRSEQMEIAASKKPGSLLEWEDMQKMKYSWNVVCETLRVYPALQGTFREVLTDFTYAGYHVPKGWKVYWSVSTTNMNPAYFRDPEKFDPSRYDEGKTHTPYTYLPFGVGPRMCPGKEYVRLTILAFVHNVVKKYRWEVLLPGEKVIGDVIPRPEKGLPLRLIPLRD